MDQLNPLNIECRYPEYRETISKKMNKEYCEKLLLKTGELGNSQEIIYLYYVEFLFVFKARQCVHIVIFVHCRNAEYGQKDK